jgi:hypothetical protein
MTGDWEELRASLDAPREEIKALRAKLNEINARLSRIDALLGVPPPEHRIAAPTPEGADERQDIA